jgi:ankyrin repeat protein
MAASRPFEHQALNLDKTEIRLFRLIPGEQSENLAGIVAVYDFECCPKYKAVSYTWRPHDPTREISLEGQSFIVGQNLWQFLDTARDHAKDWLWIDQICIDQSNNDEKSHQVRLMARIYAKAFNVLIWLGIEANGSSEAMEAIKSGFDSIHEYQSVQSQVQALFERPYWGRLWIIQEALMAQNILVLCGNKSFTWDRLEFIFLPPEADMTDAIWEHPVHINNFALSLIQEKASFKGANQRLSYILETFADLQCTDTHDKVFGLLSLVRSSGVISINYSKTLTAVFWDAIQGIIRDDSFMDIESHCDIGRLLRKRMMLEDIIKDTEISDFIKKKYPEIRKIDLKDKEDRGRLLLDTVNRSEGMVKLLLKMGANVDAKNKQGQTPLSLAAADGKDGIVKLLLKEGANVDEKNKQGQTPLLLAAKNGHEAIVKLFLNTGQVDVDSKDNNDQTPLLYAAKNGYEAVVKLLLKKSANFDAKNKQGQTPLLLAAKNGYKAIVKLLLDTGQVDVDSKDYDGQTPLLLAAKNGYKAIVKLLLATGQVDVDSKDNNDQTPLSYAAVNGGEGIVKLLLENGANVNAKDTYFSQIPLWLAAEVEHEAVVKLLLEKGANLDLNNISGRTLLSLAAENGYEGIVRLLLATSRVDVDSKDNNGQTPLSLAAENGYERIVQLLLATGRVDVDSKDNDDQMPLLYADKNGYEAVVWLLCKNGATDTRIKSRAPN